MANHRDPLALPEWQALHREAHLVSHLIGAGATALGRARSGNSFGEYYTAFFALSIGMEWFQTYHRRGSQSRVPRRCSLARNCFVNTATSSRS